MSDRNRVVQRFGGGVKVHGWRSWKRIIGTRNDGAVTDDGGGGDGGVGDEVERIFTPVAGRRLGVRSDGG